MMKVPTELWEKIRRKAEQEGRTMIEVLQSLLEQSPELKTIETPAERNCIFCGRPSTRGRICNECYYDPNIVRPQLIGAIFYHYCMVIVPDLHEAHNWRDFQRWFTREIAKDIYGVTDEEWDYYVEWRRWKEMIDNGTTTKEDPRWREFARKGFELGFVGDRAGYRCLTVLFGAVPTPKERPSVAATERRGKKNV